MCVLLVDGFDVLLHLKFDLTKSRLNSENLKFAYMFILRKLKHSYVVCAGMEQKFFRLFEEMIGIVILPN